MSSSSHAHLLIVPPNGATDHRLVPFLKKEIAAAQAITTAEQLFPSWRRELHWVTALGRRWIIIFVVPPRTR